MNRGCSRRRGCARWPESPVMPSYDRATPTGGDDGNSRFAPNRRSQLITQGVARSPNRAMLRAVGFGDGDFEKPIVGVANGHSTMNPCNAGIQPLVDRAMAALEEAGAKPQVFGVPTVTDGIGMGTEGDEVFARLARGDRRCDRDQRQRPVRWTACWSSAAATRTCRAA